MSVDVAADVVGIHGVYGTVRCKVANVFCTLMFVVVAGVVWWCD